MTTEADTNAIILEAAETYIQDMIKDHLEEIMPAEVVKEIQTYKAAGLLTTDDGLAVNLTDGSTVFITIHRQ